MRIVGCILIHDLWYSRVVTGAMSSDRSPDSLHTILNDFAEQTLAKGQVGVGFLQEREITFEHPDAVFCANLSNFIACNREDVVLCDSGDDLVLLGLVIQNGCLLFILRHELLAEQ